MDGAISNRYIEMDIQLANRQATFEDTSIGWHEDDNIMAQLTQLAWKRSANICQSARLGERYRLAGCKQYLEHSRLLPLIDDLMV